MTAAASELPLPPLPQPARRLWVAYSGGLDSTVLLHRAARLLPGRVRAVHVHHGLQPAADGWVRHCRAQCRALGIPFKLLRVEVPRAATGPEAAARAARHAAWRGLLVKGDVLALAHHADDQAETVLLRLLRGTGPTGLAGMPELAPLGAGRLWRPLLPWPRASLEAYARRHGLKSVKDPHNHDPRYARSYLRQEIMPRLQRHWPQARQSLVRAAALAAESEALLQALAAQDQAVAAAPGRALSVAALQALPESRRHNLVRHWLRGQGREAPPAAQLLRLDREILGARADAQPLLRCGDYEFRRYRDLLQVLDPLPQPPGGWQQSWRSGVLRLPPGCGMLHRAGAARVRLEVRFVRGGERLRLSADGPARSLKNLFQEQGVPPWERLRTPLVYRGEELWAAGDALLAAAARAQGFKLRWTRQKIS